MISLLTDPVLGSWRRDVDDVLAIIMLASNLYKIATTEGNGPPSLTYKTALEVKEKLKLKATVHPSPKLGLSSHQNTLEVLKETLKSSHDIVSIAPNTYLYRALDSTTSTYRNHLITIMGGYLNNKLLRIIPEFNFWKDENAAKKVVEDDRWDDRLIVPIDTTMTIKWKCNKLIRHLIAYNLTWLAKGIKPWCTTSRVLFGGFIPHDAIAAYFYKCWTGIIYCSNKIKYRKTNLIVKRSKLVETPNGVKAFVLEPSQYLGDAVLSDLFESLHQIL